MGRLFGTDGIRGMLLSDIALNSNMGYVTKLVGNAKVLGNGKITAAVSPAVIKKSDIISSTEDVFNIIKVRGDAIGDVAFYGRGAGKLPTASAVVADVLDCVKHLHARKYLFWDEGDKDYVVNPDTVAFSYLVITDAKNSDAVKSEFAVADVYEENGNVAFTLKKTAKCDLKAKMEKLGINDYRIFRVID